MGVGVEMQLEGLTAQRQRVVIAAQGFGGRIRFGSFQSLTEYAFQARPLFPGLGFLRRHRAFQSNDLRAPVGEVGIAQPAVILAARVDDPTHGVIGDPGDPLFDQPRALGGGAGIDERHPFGSHHETHVGLEGVILRGTAGNGADEGIDVFRDGFEL